MAQVNRNADVTGPGGGGESASAGGLGAYFRSLEHLADPSRAEAAAAVEFPNYDPAGLVKSSRRGFMKLAGASMALAGVTLTGCRRWPKEELVPHATNRHDRIPGLPEHYASAFELGGVADGIVVTTYDGRPIKIEGNPDHPFSLAFEGVGEAKLGRYGASTYYAQASVLEMYDPERSRRVGEGKAGARSASSLERFLSAAREALAGGGVAFVSLATSSPTVMALRQKLPAGVTWYEYEPLSHDNAREGARLALGQVVRPILDLTKADVIVSLDDDLLTSSPASLRYAADWASRRRSVDADRTMNRLYIAESVFSNTGAVADERVGVRASRVDAMARALAVALGVPGASPSGELSAAEDEWVRRAAADLRRAGKAGVVTAGTHLDPATQAVAHLINLHLGNTGTTVRYVQLPDADRPTHLAAITAFAEALKSGRLKAVFFLSGNVAYDAPADLGLAEAIERFDGFSAYLGLYENETSRLCGWHVPEAHALESWGDARGYDGTVTLLQPMIEPLFGGITKAELLAALVGEPEVSGRFLTRRVLGLSDEVAYKTALQKGVVEGTAYPEAQVRAGAFPPPAKPVDGGELELRFVRSTLYDGRYANLGWLAELPDPMTKLTWDNAILLSKTDADRLGVKTNDLVRLTVGGKTLEIAVYVLPGQPVGVAQLPLGFARKAAGTIGNGNGFDTYSLRTTGGFHVTAGSAVRTPGTYELATTQEHHLVDWVAAYAKEKRLGKPDQSGKILREATLASFIKEPRGMHKAVHADLALQLFDPPHQMNEPHAWGMAIDMSSCTGCGACVTACQAENNIPTVGKHQVLMYRVMHWIRIDRYFKHDKKTDPDVTRPQVVFQPMMCVHCENAPCEQVCPVAATVHDTEGLNTMVYNRCIGTRYCSNNCPYKVRRFNYFDYHSTSPREGLRKPYLNMPDQQQVRDVDPLVRMKFNPEVSVRMRGVMEKCTYCTQRIQAAKIKARTEHAQGLRPTDKVPDGGILTACQQACPTQAIWFGDLNDRNAIVSRRQASPRSYDVLAELNTRPRSKYMGKIRNPAVETVATTEEGH
ncbi:MAG: TAT-variant-translocated molybdopterin oxidoreductase [Tepidisphaerales bacterium]